MTTPTPPADEDFAPLSFRQRTARIAALVVILLIAAMWGWAFFATPRGLPGALENRSFPDAAEPICTKAAEQIAALPLAFTTTDHVARADVIAQANSYLSGMLDQLDQIVPSEPADESASIKEWLGDWRVYVSDRTNYAQRLQTDPEARFYVTAKDRRQITQPIDFFAKANLIYNCQVPSDIE